jgi:hypothetical protein
MNGVLKMGQKRRRATAMTAVIRASSSRWRGLDTPQAITCRLRKRVSVWLINSQNGHKTMKVLRVLIIAVVFAVPINLRAAVVSGTYRLPDSVSPGQAVKVVGGFETGKTLAAKLYLLGSTAGADAKEATLVAGEATITLPDNLAPGRYYIELTYAGAAAERIPGELRVVGNAVKLDSAYPTTAYRNAKGGFDFDVIGQNFNAGVPNDNQIYISGRGPIIQNWSPDKQGCDNGSPPCLWVESTEKLHVVGYKAESYQGPLSFSVQVGTAPRSPEKKLTLSRMSETGVLIWSIGIFLLLGYIIYWLVSVGMRDNLINGKRYSPFWSFFLDKQTNSYSLSKFQFLLFSCVFVFGYLYVFLCRWLVQWQFALPDVPSSFTGILAISAGTTLAAAGATAARGSKGSGPIMPSAADFITSGGQVIPERFQFFVWTLVACFGFLALLVSQDPATIEGFPSFPQGLLYVMGVSAGGYLGGKLARPAGPVIRSIAWDEANKQIIVQGENLSKDGDFFVDEKKLEIQPNAPKTLVDATPQDQKGPDGSFCSQLKITIVPAAGVDLKTGDHTFRIVNKDGQFADAKFTGDPPVIESVQDPTPVAAPANAPDPKKVIAKGMSERKIIVKGKGFRDGTIAKWRQQNSQDLSELAAGAVKLNAGVLEMTLVPGDAGSATLMLSTPNGFSATATVTVV